MPRIKEELIAQRLVEKFPGITCSFGIFGLVSLSNHAIGVTGDKIYLLKLSMFGMKPKDVTEIPFADIENITFDRGDIKGMDTLTTIKTKDKKYSIKSNKMIGYDPTEQAEQTYKFILGKI